MVEKRTSALRHPNVMQAYPQQRIGRTNTALALTFMTSIWFGGCTAPEQTLQAVHRLDEVTSIGEVRNVEVYMEGAKLVPPSAHSGFSHLQFCADSTLTATSCDSSAQCSHGTSCSCGRCIPRLCNSANDCTGGAVCRNHLCSEACSSGSDCPGNQQCLDGTCVTSCAGSPCPFGQHCSGFDHTCGVQLCGGSLLCPAGQTCVEAEVSAELREPTIVRFAGETTAYLHVRRSGRAPGIYRARLSAPDRWEVVSRAPVCTARDGSELSAPSAIIQEDRVHLFAAREDSRSLVHAVSHDGQSFIPDATELWSPRTPWESSGVRSPSAVQGPGGQVWVFYAVADGSGIGVLTWDGVQALPALQGPWLRPEQLEHSPYWTGITSVGSPFASWIGDRLLVYVTAVGEEHRATAMSNNAQSFPAEPNPSIGLAATTEDLEPVWTARHGPVLARRKNMRAYLGEQQPAVFSMKGKRWMVVVQSDATGERLAGLGVAPMGP